MPTNVFHQSMLKIGWNRCFHWIFFLYGNKINLASFHLILDEIFIHVYDTLHSVIRGENMSLITYVSLFICFKQCKYILIIVFLKFQFFCSYIGNQTAFKACFSFSSEKFNPIFQEVWMVWCLKFQILECNTLNFKASEFFE